MLWYEANRWLGRRCSHRSHRFGVHCYREFVYDGYCGHHNMACWERDECPPPRWRLNRLHPAVVSIMAVLVATSWAAGGWLWGLLTLTAALFSGFCIVADERR